MADLIQANGESGAASSADIRELRCPRCGGAMTHGYIAGHWSRLRWTSREKTYTVFAGEKLRRRIDWTAAPTIEAVRCERCRIGVFRYDY